MQQLQSLVCPLCGARVDPRASPGLPQGSVLGRHLARDCTIRFV